MVTLESFGFLPLNRNIEFDDGVVTPLPRLASLIEDVKEATNRDGFLYPEFPEELPVNARPAFLHKLNDSHLLRLNVPPLHSDFRQGDGAFLMYFVGYMSGYRLQFGGGWFDGRLPMTGRWWSLLPVEKERPILSEAYQTWRTWPQPTQVRFTNLLYMHIRSAIYEWDWERFAIGYMVLDGCYRVARDVHGLKAGGHENRLNALLNLFEMSSDPGLVKQIVDLRNDLVHEALWDKGQPGIGTRRGFEQAHNLWRINDRLLGALSGYRGAYLRAPWWDIGRAVL